MAFLCEGCKNLGVECDNRHVDLDETPECWTAPERCKHGTDIDAGDCLACNAEEWE